MKAPSLQLLHALREASFSFGCSGRSCGAPFSIHRARNVTTQARRSRPGTSRAFSTSNRLLKAPPKSKDRGPPSKEKTTTDFGALNVLGNVPPPTSSIDACLPDGFLLNSGLNVRNGSGCLLVAGEMFNWRPWELGGQGKIGMVNQKGQWSVDKQAWGVLDLVWPKPDILVLGLGAVTRPIAPEARDYINFLGIRIEIQDTRNAASQFNLLATERGTGQVAAALIPVGLKT